MPELDENSNAGKPAESEMVRLGKTINDLALASDNAKLAAFWNVCDARKRLIDAGADKQIVVDRIANAAEAYDLNERFGVDAIQADIAKRLSTTDGTPNSPKTPTARNAPKSPSAWHWPTKGFGRCATTRICAPASMSIAAGSPTAPSPRASRWRWSARRKHSPPEALH